MGPSSDSMKFEFDGGHVLLHDRCTFDIWDADGLDRYESGAKMIAVEDGCACFYHSDIDGLIAALEKVRYQLQGIDLSDPTAEEIAYAKHLEASGM